MYMNTRTYTYTHVHAYINVYTQISVSVCMFLVLFLNRTNDKPSKCPISALMFLYKKKKKKFKINIAFSSPCPVSRGLHNNPNFKRGNPCLFYPPRRYPSPTSVADPQSLQPVFRRFANATQIIHYFSTLKKKKEKKKNSRILTVNKTRHLEAFFPNLKILSFYVLDS